LRQQRLDRIGLPRGGGNNKWRQPRCFAGIQHGVVLQAGMRRTLGPCARRKKSHCQECKHQWKAGRAPVSARLARQHRGYAHLRSFIPQDLRFGATLKQER
jgi:hypothetical protein